MEWTVVPADRAVDATAGLTDRTGATLGIPGITAHRAVFGDGTVAGRTVLVHGVLGAVGSLAGQLARWGGATVIGTVRSAGDLVHVRDGVADHLVPLDREPAAEIRRVAPDGVDRIVEVALDAHADLGAEVAAQAAVISAYATDRERTAVPFWPLLFSNVTLRLIGSDDFPAQARTQAVQDLTVAVTAGMVAVPIAAEYPLEQISAAHDAVDCGGLRGRVLVTLPAAGV